MDDYKFRLTGDTKYEVPQPTGQDMALAAFTAALSALPVAGGAIREVMQLLESPVERRRNEWMESVAAALRRLEANGITIESLKSNEQFVSAVLQATVIAQRTHHKEKLDALRNALMNIATAQAPDEALQSIFLNHVDAFTDWHIKILRLFQAPTAHGGMTELYEILEHAYPQLQGRREVYDAVWSDLATRELVNVRFLHGKMGTESNLVAKRTTSLGDLFLGFISEPSGFLLHHK